MYSGENAGVLPLKFGCSISALAMLFKWYGILNTPVGSPVNPVPPYQPGLQGELLNPGTLNSALANYETFFSTKGSVAFDSINDLIWEGAAQVGRASNQTPVSWIGTSAIGGDATDADGTKAAIKAIQNEICAGNPVILKVKSNSLAGQHFLLAKSIVVDPNTHIQTLNVSNPGRSQGANQLYDQITGTYPQILETRLFHGSLSDPAFMDILASPNVHLVISDPLNRRTGYDPTTQTVYNEIPGANYSLQSINTPSDPGFTPETLVQEQYFSSSTEVMDGGYQVKVFGLNSGSYYLDSRSFDSAGDFNDSQYKTGTIKAGQVITLNLMHSSQTISSSNAKLSLVDYSLFAKHKDFAKANIDVIAKITPLVKSKMTLVSNFRFMVGGAGGFDLSIPASQFKALPSDQDKDCRDKKAEPTHFIYRGGKAEIHVWSSGEINIRIHDANLSNLDSNQFDQIRIEIDSTAGDTNAKLNCHDDFCSIHYDRDRGHEPHH